MTATDILTRIATRGAEGVTADELQAACDAGLAVVETRAVLTSAGALALKRAARGEQPPDAIAPDVDTKTADDLRTCADQYGLWEGGVVPPNVWASWRAFKTAGLIEGGTASTQFAWSDTGQIVHFGLKQFAARLTPAGRALYVQENASRTKRQPHGNGNMLANLVSHMTVRRSP